MSDQLDTTTWGAIVLSALGGLGAAFKAWHSGFAARRAAKEAAAEAAEAADKQYLRDQVRELTADIRALLATAQHDAAEARAEAASLCDRVRLLERRVLALRDRVRLLERRVLDLETENQQLRHEARRAHG